MNAGEELCTERDARFDPLVVAIEAARSATRRRRAEAAATDVLAALTAPGYEPALDLGVLFAGRS